ncbi:hypothetical protein SPOG_04111 [Schizosaccharomyces cryophilus OY26]|uniref:Proteasome assembly chaperone 3 n=1 Tax=Schizosaccharomyces cryophilus (strain OY26 / ATCC MYA-4695 / CBS 11777 / NBRC 106824 / NRRL Y48691) TaxID=653667 RepID=S9W2F2_SCHCR|nr:uncharacterized protein SPOG_04111 [Schizosaccharomyces cryophilus OY26]EPY54218.1 hypothetical protein SPOG_04111 [Schizosaccharomyces cryophilus OY26]
MLHVPRTEDNLGKPTLGIFNCSNAIMFPLTRKESGDYQGIRLNCLAMKFGDQITILITMTGKIGQMFIVNYERSVVSPLVLNEDMSSLPEIGVRTVLGDRDDFKAHWGQLLASQIGSLLAKQQMENTSNSKVLKLCLGLHVPWDLSDEKNGDLSVFLMELIQRVRVW